MGARREGVSRRQLLQAAGIGSAGVAVAGMGTAVAADRPHSSTATVPFDGAHQGGIATPQQRHVELAAFDVVADEPQVLAALLATWTAAARRMCAGRPAGAPAPIVTEPTDDLDTAGLAAARLTLTVGFGPSLFAPDRFGLDGVRPAPLADLPAFATDHLQPQWCGGDVMVQACADDPTVTVHAVRTLLHLAQGRAALRWAQAGFASPPPRPQRSRNLLGFEEGIGNLDAGNAAAMQHHVWVGDEGPRWMRGGTYAVVRRIRLRLDEWDEASLDEQQRAVGRRKADGARLAPSPHAHVQLASAAANGGVRLLRRGYNYTASGLEGALDAGLLFIAFQRDPRRQFVRIQERLAASDALNEYLRHEGSAVFAVPAGTAAGTSWGAGLLPGPGAGSA